MQLKDLGNLSNVLNKLNSSSNIVQYFNSLDSSMQKCVITSGNLTKEQLGLIVSGTTFAENAQGIKTTVSGLSKAEFEAAIKTSSLSTAQKGAAISTAGFTSALKGLWATMMANPLLLIGMAVTAGIGIWSKYKQSVEEARQATAEAAQAYGEVSSSIDDYANRYSKLHDELTNANTSEEEQHKIKSDLLSLQQELNEKYGDEYGRLNLVTDAYKDQTEAIRQLNKIAAQKYLNENVDTIDKAQKKMTKKKTYMVAQDIGMFSGSGKAIFDYARSHKDELNLENPDVYAPTGTFSLRLSADPTEANKAINDFMTYVDSLKEKYGEKDPIIKSVLGISSSSLNQTKDLIADYGDTYNKALVAQIATSDKLSVGYSDATSAVKKYNDAIASGDEKKILSARDDLNKVKDTIDLTSSDWKKYASVMNEVFNQADTGIYDFADDLNSNKDNLMTIVGSLRGKSKEDILAMDDAENNDGFNKLKAAADKYGLSVDQVIDQLIKLNIVQGDVGESGQKSLALSKEEVISSVNSLSEGFESLDKIMSSMKGKNPFDFALLDDKKFKDSFSGLGEAYTNFIETVSDSPKDVKGAQSAFDDLTTAWIDSKLALNGYTEENANLIASMLKNMGVANAEEVVASRLAFTQEHLAAQKAYTAEMSDALANATADEIPGLIDEATQSDIAKVALAGLALEKANANGTILDTSGDIENAIALINTIGSATSALVAYNKAKAGDIFDANTQKANLDNLLSQRTGLGMSMAIDNQLNAYQEKMDKLKADADKQVQDAINTSRNYQGKGASANYAGANKSNKAGSDKKKEETQNDIDWIARKTKIMQDEYSKLEELANKDTVAYLGLTQEQFDKAKSIFDNGLGNTNEGLSELQSYADKAGLSLGELYTMIQSGAPGASKENALQGMLKMQTETLLPQYQQEVEAYSKAYADALKAIPSEYKDKIENGGIEIESLPSDLGKKVQTAIDANEKLKASQKQLADGETEHIKTIKDLHENRINAINTENEKLEQSNKIIKSQMELMEARGEIIDADFYKQQKNNNKGLISGNEQDIAEWESEMADLRAAKVSVKSKDYKELQAKVKAAKNEIQGLRIEQEEINQALEQMPIDNLNTIVSMYKDISSAIEKWGDVASATGGKLSADYYQTLISNGATTIDQYQELASEIRNVMDNQEEGSTRWNELYGQLQSVNSEMSSMVQNLKKWNEELLKMPLDNINNYSSELQKVADGLSGVKEEYDTAISAVTGAIKEQIDAINEQKDAVNEEYDAQKKALQDKLDLMNKQNKELQLQQKYEQALYNLQKANQQATEKVIRDGQVVYEQNADKLRDAQEAVQSAKFDMETDKIQTQIDDLQKTLDGLNEKYQDQIDSLQKISDKWSEISEKITQAQNEAKAEELLGVGWKDKVLSGKDVELFNNFSGMYANTAEQLRQYQEQINNTNNIYSLLEDYINSYKEGTLSYDQALTGINNLLAQMNQTMTAEGNLQNIYDYLGAMNGTAANAENVLSGIKQGLANTATELIDSFKQYNQNAGLISEYTSSWQQLTDNVASMLNVLEEVRDNLENASEDGDDDDDEDGSPFRKGSSGYVNSGPGVKAYKNGIENGLVGASSTSDREAKMKLLGLKKMDQDEITAILHKNEAVFNPEQQDILLKNLATAWNFTPSKTDYSTLSPNCPNLTTQEFKFGDINIQECNDTEGLANGILSGGLKRAIIQQSGIR